MLTFLSFLLALVVIIFVHEYGHYRAALACGVKVTRFSLGFGKPLMSWQVRQHSVQQQTEFVISALPFGGYVQMLDSKTCLPDEQKWALDTQRLWKRVVVVSAGPLANFALAILIYSACFIYGEIQPRAILSAPSTHSLMHEVGLRSGDLITKGALINDEFRALQGYSSLNWLMIKARMSGSDVLLEVQSRGKSAREIIVPLSQLPADKSKDFSLKDIGLTGPWTAPVIAEPLQGGVAQLSGLKRGDVVLKVQGEAIEDAGQLREKIRQSGRLGDPEMQLWEVNRRGQGLVLIEIKPKRVWINEEPFGRIEAKIGEAPTLETIRYDFFTSLQMGAEKTWEQSWLTLELVGQILVGLASWQHLSGPITMADAAGKSAESGWQSYLQFLALVSVSVGILNLLPIPVLDGGHLLYYLWEAVVGTSPSEVWLERFQKLGLGVILMLMSFALFNDLQRWIGAF